MRLLIGTWDSAWGHTWAARGNGKVYMLRSLPEKSALCVYDGKTMQPLGEFPVPGAHPCHITLLAGQAVLSDYTSGTTTVLDLDSGGMPSGEPAVIRYGGNPSHIHSSWISPDGAYLVVADLGADMLMRFRLSDGRLGTGAYEQFRMPDGCGPRHCAFGQDRLYVSTELSDEVLVLEWPSMKLLQRCTVNDAKPGGGGHIVRSADGRFIYVSSRLQNDGIAVFGTGPDGLLEKLGYCPTGRHPRHFCLTPDGKTLLAACRDDNVVQVFDCMDDGTLRPCGQSISIEKPVYVEAYEEN